MLPCGLCQWTSSRLCVDTCSFTLGVDNWLTSVSLIDEDYGFTSEATNIVDALVSDDADEGPLTTPAEAVKQFGLSRTPSVPPGLGFTMHSHPPRTSTPSQAPPGFLVQPTPTAGPALPIASAAPVTPSKPSFAHQSVVAPESSKGKAMAAPNPGSDAKKNIKAFAVESGLSRDIASQAKTSVKDKKPVLKDEDFPALESAKAVSRTSTPAPTKAPSMRTPMGAKKTLAETPKAAATPLAQDTPVDVSPAPRSKKAEKKAVPGALNIAAATKAAAAAKKSNPSSTVTSAIEKPDDAAFPALPTPTSASVASPAARGAPKTLRLLPTPKAETPPATSASANAPPSLRQAFSVLQRPETPVSENISDSASMVSASVSASRTNSPPPSRIGTAAIRSTTKSQQRKARKDATKQQAAAIAAQPKLETDVEVAPIVSHKKKQKKGKAAPPPKETPVKEATPVNESRPSSPAPAEKDAKPAAEEKVSTYRQAVNESMSLEEPLVPRLRRKETSSASVSEASKPVVDRASPSPAAVFRDLAKEGSIPDPEGLALLKSVSSTSHRSDQHMPILPKHGVAELKSIVSEEDQHTLIAGKPVHKIIDGSRVLLTPNGDLVRNLTEAEEQRYLHYQSSIAAKAGDPAAYVHSRHSAGSGFSVIKGRAVANGTPSYFPQGPSTNTSADNQLALPTVENPVQKMGREEALGNINQCILPHLNLETMNLSLDGAKMSDSPNNNNNNTPRGGASAGAGVSTVQQTLEHEKQEAVVRTLIGSVMNGQAASQTRGSSFDTNGAEFSGLAQTMPPPPLMPSTAANATVSLTKGLLSGHLSNITSMSLEEMEEAFARTKKEAEKIEKSLNQVIKKNRRMLSLSSSGAAGSH